MSSQSEVTVGVQEPTVLIVLYWIVLRTEEQVEHPFWSLFNEHV